MGKPDSAEFDFGRFTEERTEHFTGREWLFRTIADWLDDPKAPTLFMLTLARARWRRGLSSFLAASLLHLPAPSG